MNSTLWIALALGLRHGTDPDHLTAIDGLSRLRPRATNGLLFALGHGLVVTLLAAGVGHVAAGRIDFLGPWMLILIGVVTLWKLLRPSPVIPAMRITRFTTIASTGRRIDPGSATVPSGCPEADRAAVRHPPHNRGPAVPARIRKRRPHPRTDRPA